MPFVPALEHVGRTFICGSVCIVEDVADGLFTADVTSGILR